MIRLVSDLHIDVNRDGNFGFKNREQDALFIAGDIAGSYEKEIKWLKGLSSTVHSPVFAVCGNHLGYEYYTDAEYMDMQLFGYKKQNPLIGTKQWSIDKIKESVPENIHYLDNEWVEWNNYIIFGGCMYADYHLYENEDLCKRSGEAYLNDFRYVHIYDKEMNVVRPVNTDDYQKYFDIFKQKLIECINETNNSGKDIIILSHFTPSIRSISERYLNQGNVYLNASYASNLDYFIRANKRIKYFFHGHVHSEFDYYIGQCRVVCCPYGYKGREQLISPKKWYGKTIDI